MKLPRVVNYSGKTNKEKKEISRLNGKAELWMSPQPLTLLHTPQPEECQRTIIMMPKRTANITTAKSTEHQNEAKYLIYFDVIIIYIYIYHNILW